MSADRVDKSWKSKGLTAYSDEAILNTLAHYGVNVDEASFRDVAKESTPLRIAGEWKPKWKGTGQFQLLPYFAAEELVRRWLPDRFTPFQLAQTLINAMARADEVLAGQPDQTAALFAEFEKKKGSLPPEVELRSLFNSEVVGFLEHFDEAFSRLPKELVKAGHRDLAFKFAQLHETIFPSRAGLVTGLVRALTGEREPALKELAAIVADANRDVFARHTALDSLWQADAWSDMRAGLGLFDACAAQKQWPVADSVAHLLAAALKKSSPVDEAYAAEVYDRVELAHQHVEAHGHGH